MRHVLHALHVLLEATAGVEPGNLASRRHDGLDVAVGEREHALDHLALLAPEALVNDAVLGRLFIIPARLARHQAHDGVRRALAERHAVEVSRGIARGKLVEEFDEDREGDRSVEIALRNVEAEPLGDEAAADHQQEREAEHHHRRMTVDKVRERTARGNHHDHGDHDGTHHHVEVVDHADGGDDGVEREDRVKKQDLGDDDPEAGPAAAVLFRVRQRLEALVQLGRGLEEQEEAAAQKDQVPERERVSPDREDGVGEGHEPRHDGEKAQTHRERKSEAHVEGLVLL